MGGLGGRHRRLRIVAVVIAALSLGLAFALAWLTSGVTYGEVTFFLDRMAQLVAGYRPFADFSYGYALGGLYGPVWLWRLLRGHGVRRCSPTTPSMPSFCCAPGRCSTCSSRSQPERPASGAALFCLGGVCVVNITAGIQYTLVRYLMPPVVLLAVHLTVTRTNHRWRPFAAGLVALAGAAGRADLLDAGDGAGDARGRRRLLHRSRAQRAARRRAGGAHPGGGPGTFRLLSQGYFSLVFSFAAGAFNLPVVPGPPALLYVLAMFIVAVLLPSPCAARRSPNIR